MPIAAKAVLFDYGNTLEMDPFNDILEKHGQEFVEILRRKYKVQEEDFLEAWRTANGKMNWPYASHFSQEEPFIQRALKDCGLEQAGPIFAPAILAAYRLRLTEHRKASPTAPVVRDVLGGLKRKNKIVGIVSNDREWAPGACMKAYGAYGFLDAIFTSEGIGIEKPDPRIFERVCDHLNVNLNDICYVGDDPVRDVQCPKKLGIKAVLFVPPDKYKQSEDWRNYNSKINKKPDAVITDLRELLELII